MNPIKWERHKKELRALPVTLLRDEDLIPIQQWCEANQCGRRMSFDTFRFKTRADITAFLLRWS